MLVEDPQRIEKCSSVLLEDMKIPGKEQQELYKVDFDTVKTAVCNCALSDKAVRDVHSMSKLSDLNHYIVFQ